MERHAKTVLWINLAVALFFVMSYLNVEVIKMRVLDIILGINSRNFDFHHCRSCGFEHTLCCFSSFSEGKCYAQNRAVGNGVGKYFSYVYPARTKELMMDS